jgi:hypothetical protein
VNLTATVLIRQQHVLNVRFGLAGRGSRSWPLWLRWSVSKVHHVGGIHVGGALAGTAWLCAFTVVATVARAQNPASVSVTALVLSYALVALALLVVACALPPVRSRAHNVFENSHRFGGWTSIGLFWALTLHLDAPGWHVWMLALVTASIASPWLRLRRVPVTVERPSSHAAIVRFDYGVTPASTLVDEVEAAQPHAVVWDTSERGKPDLLRLARRAYEEFDAEAVFVVSNQATTRRLVHGLDRLGIPAFGPIWDS